MQSYFQCRRIYRQLQKQIVTKHGCPEDVCTHERRYWYPSEGGLASESLESQDEGTEAQKWRAQGQRTWIAGPALEPHTARSHMERDGDVERVDMDPEFNVDPYTINSRDTIGSDLEMVVTGVERERDHDHQVTEPTNGAPSPSADETARGRTQKEKQNVLIVVSYEGDTDPMDPHNWSLLRRFACTTLISWLGSVALWSSTIVPPALNETTKEFHTTFEVQSLPTGFFLILLGCGGILAGPISEVFGRNPVYIVSLTMFIVMDTIAAVATKLAQRIIFRGLAGLFASGPLVCSAAALVDLWSVVERIYIFPFFTMTLELAATVGPAIGSNIVMATAISWRFVDWTIIILAAVLLILVILVLPETYSPILLQWKAQQLRRLTGDDRYRAPLEFKKVPISRRIRNAFHRPLIFFWTEPIILLFAVYMAFIFITLYTFSAGFTAIFENHYHLNKGETGLCFLPITFGVLMGGLLAPITMKLIRRDIAHANRHGRARPEPECNLYMAMFGAPAVPISLLWMGWTARPSISIWSPLAAGVLFGSGVLGLIVASYQYIAATFEYHTASALSTIQAVRFAAAGAMSVLAHIMYRKLGSTWTLTLLAGISLLFLPFPFLLFRWGSTVRHWSRLAREKE